MPIIATYKDFNIWYNSQIQIYIAIKDNEICFASSTLDDLKKQIDNEDSNSTT